MFSVIRPIAAMLERLRFHANQAGELFGLLGIRMVLAFEYADAGLKNLQSSNWFGNVQHDFPFPFNVLPVDVSWHLATWTQLLGAAALMIGFATRLFGISLFILTVVAWISVHAGNGYNVCNQGFKLPLIFLTMLLPLILSGPGHLSLDYLLLEGRRKAN
jgi:putative oxidoreductase